MRQSHHRAGLRHAVAGKDIDTKLERGQAERLRHGGTADDHFPVAQVDLADVRVAEQHMQDGRHAVREGHLLRLDQPEQRSGA